MSEELREEEGYEFIIVGDTERFNDCLITPCGKKLDRAKEVLQKCIDQSDENLVRLCRGHSNFRIERIKSADAWWNGYLD